MEAPETPFEQDFTRAEVWAAIGSLPEGMVYLNDDQTLNKALLHQGKKLWIDGNLTVVRRSGELLGELEALRVTGRAVIPQELEETFSELDPLCEDVLPYRGTLIASRETVTIDRAILEREGHVTVYGCEVVTMDPSLTAGEIEDGLTIRHCEVVICATGQIPAVQSVSRDVDSIGPKPGGAPEPEDPDMVTINCGSYSF